jgi:GNAT superfamily N-acetyltransferase
MGRVAWMIPYSSMSCPTRPSARGVPLLMRFVLCTGRTHGEVWTTPQPITGIASWISPAHLAVTQAGREAAGFADLSASRGPEAVVRFDDVRADVGEAESLAAAEPHWYLHWHGTEPSAQGRGIGSTLVRQVTTHADAEGVAYPLLNDVTLTRAPAWLTEDRARHGAVPAH